VVLTISEHAGRRTERLRVVRESLDQLLADVDCIPALVRRFVRERLYVGMGR